MRSNRAGLQDKKNDYQKQRREGLRDYGRLMGNPFALSVLENRRLGFSLTVAVILHLLVMVFMPWPRVIPFTQPSGPRLNVRLTPVTPLAEKSRVKLSKKDSVPATKNAKPTREMLPIYSRSVAKNRLDERGNMPAAADTLEQPTATASSPPSIPPSPSAPSVESVFDSAKGIVRDEARRMTPSETEEIDLQDRPILPEFAKALQKQKVGETRLANGLIKIVTPSGKVRCYTPLPDIVARGGPIEPALVPTNCP